MRCAAVSGARNQRGTAAPRIELAAASGRLGHGCGSFVVHGQRTACAFRGSVPCLRNAHPGGCAGSAAAQECASPPSSLLNSFLIRRRPMNTSPAITGIDSAVSTSGVAGAMKYLAPLAT